MPKPSPRGGVSGGPAEGEPSVASLETRYRKLLVVIGAHGLMHNGHVVKVIENHKAASYLHTHVLHVERMHPAPHGC